MYSLSVPGGAAFALREPEEVSAYIDLVKEARLASLNAAQRSVRAAFWKYAGTLNLRGVALAEGVYTLFVGSLSRVSSLAALDYQLGRLSRLQTVLPTSVLAVRPFLSALAERLPQPSDTAAAVSAGLYVPPSALASVQDVLQYGSEVYEARLQHLHSCQASIKRCYNTYMYRLKVRAEALAALAASRTFAMLIASSDLELNRLLASVTGAASAVPKSAPVLACFAAAAHSSLPPQLAQLVAPFAQPDAVVEFARERLTIRLAELNAASSRIAVTFRNYRYKMHTVAKALANLAVTILLSFATAHSDLALLRLAQRLESTLARVPKIPEVKESHFKVRVGLMPVWWAPP